MERGMIARSNRAILLALAPSGWRARTAVQSAAAEVGLSLNGVFEPTERMRVNDRIRAREVRVVDDDGGQLGVMQPFEAIRWRASADWTWWKFRRPPTRRFARSPITESILYQTNKKAHEQRKHQKGTQLKEVKFRPATAEHDYQVRKNQIIRFLGEGHKVKAMIFHRGREMAHQEVGRAKMDRLLQGNRRSRAGRDRAAHGSEYPDGAAGAKEGRRAPPSPPRRKPERRDRVWRLPEARKACEKRTASWAITKARKLKLKLKTHRGAAKRFKITANGKVLRMHSGKRHLMGTKKPKRMRHLKKMTLVQSDGRSRARRSRMLPYG